MSQNLVNIGLSVIEMFHINAASSSSSSSSQTMAYMDFFLTSMKRLFLPQSEILNREFF